MIHAPGPAPPQIPSRRSALPRTGVVVAQDDALSGGEGACGATGEPRAGQAGLGPKARRREGLTLKLNGLYAGALSGQEGRVR